MSEAEIRTKLEQVKANIRNLQSQREQATRDMRRASDEEYRLVLALSAERTKMAELIQSSPEIKNFIAHGTPLAAA